MLKVRRIIRDYSESGSVNSLLAVWGFVDEHAFLTKAGHVGLVYRLAGSDFECLDRRQRRDIVHRFEAALRLLDENCRVYQYLCKRRVRPIVTPPCAHPVVDEAVQRRAEYLNARRSELYDIELYLVLVYEGLQPRFAASTRLRAFLRQPRRAVREWLSSRTVLQLIETDLDRAVTQLYHKATTFEVQLADTTRPTRLKKAEAFRFLRRLVNYNGCDDDEAALKYDSHVDYFMADSAVECHRSHLDVNGVQLKALTMKEPPNACFAQLLEDLYTVPGEFIACLEWCRIPNDRTRREIHTRRRHFFNKRVSLVNYVAPDTRPEEMLVDESATAIVKQLGDALTELEVNGHFFGESSLTVVLYDEESQTVERAAAEAIKVMASHDGTLVEETYNLLNA